MDPRVSVGLMANLDWMVLVDRKVIQVEVVSLEKKDCQDLLDYQAWRAYRVKTERKGTKVG